MIDCLSNSMWQISLRVSLEDLAVKLSYSYTLGQRTILCCGRSSSLNTYSASGRYTWGIEGGWGHLPNQPDQPWQAMRWQLSEPVLLHILYYVNDILILQKVYLKTSDRPVIILIVVYNVKGVRYACCVVASY